MKPSSSSSSSNRLYLIVLVVFALFLVLWLVSADQHHEIGDHNSNNDDSPPSSVDDDPPTVDGEVEGKNNHQPKNEEDQDRLLQETNNDKDSTRLHNSHNHRVDLSLSSSSFSKAASCMMQKVSSSIPTVVRAVGSYPIGTYVCSYLFPNDKSKQKSCSVQCPLRDPYHPSKNTNKFFTCQIREKAKSKAEALSSNAWDLMFFHYGAPPLIPDRQKQLVVFYSGESNITEAKRAKPDYQSKFSHVVSCHHSRRFYFTWTARHVQDFTAIASSAKERSIKIAAEFAESSKKKNSIMNNNNEAAAAGDTTEVNTLIAESYRKEWHEKIDAIVIFVSRCGKGGRDKIVEALRTSGGIPVHSFGKCQRTHHVAKMHPECIKGSSAVVPPGEEKKGIDRYGEKLCVFRKYRYVLALENSAEEDYVTEKLYHGLIAGAIPIYLGAPNVDNFVPLSNSYIPLNRYYKKDGDDKKKNFLEMDSAIRTNPKGVLDFEKIKSDFGQLDVASSEKALGNKEESSATYWLDSLLGWRRVENVEDFRGSNPKFLENLYHREPTCDLCNLALQRKCEPGA